MILNGEDEAVLERASDPPGWQKPFTAVLPESGRDEVKLLDG